MVRLHIMVRRRDFLQGLVVASTIRIAGCGMMMTPGTPTEMRTETENDSETRFLKEGETPDGPGAREFLETVAEVTGGRTGFHGEDDTWRVRFSENGDTWQIKYYGTALSGEPFREELADLSTAFASHRPNGMSLEATVRHECTTGTWEVSADTAAAYEREELSRKEFVNRVYESVETENNC